MRIISNIFIIVLAISLLLPGNSLLAKGKWTEFSKTIEKEHTIGQTGELDIETKYSNINVTTWDKETVAVKIVITVESRSETEAEELLQFINVEFTEREDFLKCATRNSYHENYTWRDYLPWNISNYKSLEYKIEYTVQMPYNAKLEIENKHGNISLSDIGGSAIIEQKYGNLSAGAIGGDLRLYLKHGNGSVNSTKDLKADLGYSNLSINKSEHVILESRHSKVEIKEAQTLKTESRYDDIEVGKVDALSGECRYSDYDIGEISSIKVEASYSDFIMDHLTQSIKVDLRYGDFVVKELDDNFKEIDINSEYTDVDIDLDESIDYSLDVEGIYLKVPKKIEMLKSNIEDNTSDLIIKTKEKIKGLPLIRAKMRHGSLKVE